MSTEKDPPKTVTPEEVPAEAQVESDFSEAQQVVCSIIPPLNSSFHKGQAGRIGVIGGSKEYTGAPYFSAISALKVGADLSYVFCSSDSSAVIKGYSPELIVLPALDQTNALEEIGLFLPRLHALVIGPGLGRNDQALSTVGSLITSLKEKEIPIVLDADALYFVSQCPEIVRGYTRAILTPNIVEFDRLYSSVFRTESKNYDDPKAIVEELAKTLGHITILRKGPIDIVSDGHNTFTCNETGSPRRCGGQGDLLSGSMGAFTHWSHNAFRSSQLSQSPIYQKYSPTIIAALGASMLTRRCARLAFSKYGRSMTTTNLISEIREAFNSLYPVDWIAIQNGALTLIWCNNFTVTID